MFASVCLCVKKYPRDAFMDSTPFVLPPYLQEKLPIKWMPLETLCTEVFTLQSEVWVEEETLFFHLLLSFLTFVLRKTGSKAKKRTKKEKIEEGNYGPPTRKIFLRFCWTWTKRYLITSQTRVNRVSRIHHRNILFSSHAVLWFRFPNWIAKFAIFQSEI